VKVTRIFADENETSAFSEVEVPLHDQGAIGRISDPIPVTGLMFRETSADHYHDWHQAPRRQYIVLLDGEIEITVGTGESRRFSGGDILLVEDTTGKGHLTQHVQQQVRRSLFLPLPEEPS